MQSSRLRLTVHPLLTIARRSPTGGCSSKNIERNVATARRFATCSLSLQGAQRMHGSPSAMRSRVDFFDGTRAVQRASGASSPPPSPFAIMLAAGCVLTGWTTMRTREREAASCAGSSVPTKAAGSAPHDMNTHGNAASKEASQGGEASLHKDPMWRSQEGKPVERKFEGSLLFSGGSNLPLSQDIASALGKKLGAIQLKRFADGEVSLQILDSLRGRDVYLIQPTSPPVNENLMELLLMVSTCRRASAKKITAVIPYFGYARQDRKLSSRVPISAADVAKLIETMGVDRVVAVDLHCGQIQGFFGPRVPVDNLEAQIIGLQYFARKGLSRKVMVVSPDAGGVYRARKFQEGLIARDVGNVGIAMLIKQRAGANQIEKMDLVGSVEGADVIIVDDMIDTAGTLCEAARELKKKGAQRVFAFATHGLFSGPALQRIEASPLEEVVVTDTIKATDAVKSCAKIIQLQIGILIADAIRRIHLKESLHDLFNTR